MVSKHGPSNELWNLLFYLGHRLKMFFKKPLVDFPNICVLLYLSKVCLVWGLFNIALKWDKVKKTGIYLFMIIVFPSS